MATAALVFAGMSLLVDLVNALQMTNTFGPCRGQYVRPLPPLWFMDSWIELVSHD